MHDRLTVENPFAFETFQKCILNKKQSCLGDKVIFYLFTYRRKASRVYNRFSQLTLKTVGAHSGPPSMFTLLMTKIANWTDSNSNCKFINIRCGRFDTILRSIQYSVKFWRPSARIGRQNLIFPKIKPTNLFSLEIFYCNFWSRKKILGN